jgi:hypothetical protein
LDRSLADARMTSPRSVVAIVFYSGSGLEGCQRSRLRELQVGPPDMDRLCHPFTS